MQKTSPEKWLTAELTGLLEHVLKALDALAWLPFDSAWTRELPGIHYTQLLKQIEKQLLCMWVRMQRGHWNVLETEVLVWHGRQKRSPGGVLSHYHALFENLSKWCSVPEIRKQGMRCSWESFLVLSLCSEEHLLKRTAKSLKKRFPLEVLSLTRRYLKMMQCIHDTEPRELCTSFFTLLSPFTRESIYLSAFPNENKENPPPETEISRFSRELLDCTDWETMAETYLKLLRDLD